MIGKECIKSEVNLLSDLFLIKLEEFDEKIKNLSTKEKEVLLRNQRLDFILNGGKGSGNFNPGQGRGIGKPSKSSILSNKMKSLSWNETQDLLRDKETRQIIKEIGLKTYDDLWNMWAKVKVEDFTEKDIKEIDIDDAFDVVKKNIRLSALEGWFVNADSNYKPEIVTKILENKELRNAGLNIAYYNYKNRFESDILFSDFIKTPISLYRGEHGQTHVEQDWFDAYTPAKDIAEGFGEIVTEIKIKPIETLGAYFDNAESEYLVLTKTSMLKNSIGNARINRLDKLNLKFNGGPGSGNFNPGQGRGIGKPNKGGIFDKSESQIKNEWDNIDDNVEIDKDTEKFLKTYYFGSWFFGNVQKIARQKNIDIMNSFEKKQATKTMKTLDNLINKSSLSKDVVLFRGITMTDDNANSIKEGSIISDSGFASSTIDPNKAIIKRGRPETGGKRNIILMKIDAKKGQKALKSPIDTEYEFVLPRNSKFKVKSVSEQNNNIRIVEVEYE